MRTGVNRAATPIMVSIEVAAAEPNSGCSPDLRFEKIKDDSELAFASAEKPTIGSKIRKLSIRLIRATNVANGTR